MSFYKDKVIWMIGCSSGIGRAMAIAFAKEGAKMILSSRREDELQLLAKEIGIPENTLVLPVDLENLGDTSILIANGLKRFEKIDFFINCGGVGQKGFVEENPIDVDRKVFEVNFFGGIALTKAVIPIMKSQGFGHIVAVSSLLGKFGLSEYATYSASKHALYGYYETLRQELLSDGIHVNILCPGTVNTRVTYNFILPDGSKFNEAMPAQENGMLPSTFAKHALTALRKNKQHAVIASLSERIALLFKQYFPNLFYWMINKMLSKKKK